MVNDPEHEREGVGGREPMDNPAETGPQTTREDDEELEAPDFAPEKRQKE